MPLKLGMQKLVNQWVNVNKEHVVFRDKERNSPTTGGTLAAQSSPKGKGHRRHLKKVSEDDGYTVITASTADATASVSTMSTNRSGPQKAENTCSKLPSQVPACISLQNLSFSRHLRRGAFGISYTGKLSIERVKNTRTSNDTTEEPGQETLAVEIQVVTTFSSPEQFNWEIAALKELPPHPSLNQFHGWTHLSAGRFDNKESYGLVYKLDQRVSLLNSWLNDLESASIGVPKAFYWDILGDAINGLAHLHSYGIEHGSMTPDNILVHARRDKGNALRLSVKLADFGLMEILDHDMEKGSKNSKDQELQRFRSCSRYSSPEFIRSHGSERQRNTIAKFKSDIFSYGMLAWFLITREVPYKDQENDDEVFEKVCYDDDVPHLPIPRNMPKYLKLFMEKCWSSNPRHRPSAIDIMNRSLKELKNVLLNEHEMEWIHHPQGHQVYKTEESKNYQLEIPHRKMSELSVQDHMEEQDDPQETFDSKTNPALQIYSKRNLDMDVSILTKSQRKGLMRLKRLKFTRRKDKSDQKQKKIEITEDSSNSSKRSWLSRGSNKEQKKNQEKNIPFVPMLVSAANPMENGSVAVRPPPLPLIQPILANPKKFKERKQNYVTPQATNLNEKFPPPIQILHFNHADPVIEFNIEDDDELSGQDDTSDEDLVIRKPHTFPQYVSRTSNVRVGVIAPPTNFRSVFRTNSCGVEYMHQNKNDNEKAKLEAAEVLTSHFSRK